MVDQLKRLSLSTYSLDELGVIMNLTSELPYSSLTQPATLTDAKLIHKIYLQTPCYFDSIAIEMPTFGEVKDELEIATKDPSRYVELVVDEGQSDLKTDIIHAETGKEVLGYLDYKLDYPDKGDATVNLLMISAKVQRNGLGKQVVRGLEKRLKGRVSRVLASIYGENPSAEGFWRSLEYRFEIDAKPILDWYAKEL